MTVTAEQLTDIVLKRTRDPDAVSENVRFVIRRFLDLSQRIVNASKPGFIFQVVYTIPPGVVLMNVQDFAPGAEPDGTLPPRCLRVMRVAYEGGDLDECQDWRQVGLLNRKWLLDRDHRPRLWARVGRDFLIVYPGAMEPYTVTIHYAAQPTRFTAETTPSDLRDDRLPTVRAMAEVLQLMRQQDVKNLPKALDELKSQVTWLPIARTAPGA